MIHMLKIVVLSRIWTVILSFWNKNIRTHEDAFNYGKAGKKKKGKEKEKLIIIVQKYL